MRIAPAETLLAIKAFVLCDDLTNSTRRVAVALIESFNRKTGQCDPSIETLARLLNISARTVMRSVDLLVAKTYFSKDRHGGHFNRNAYTPNWPKLRAINAAWNARRGSSKSAATPMTRSRCRESHVGGDTGVAQTYLSNLQKKPCDAEPQQGDNCGHSSSAVGKRPSNEEASTSEQRIASKRFHVKTKPSSEAARDEAERRWTQTLTDQARAAPDAFASMLDGIDDKLREETTTIEMQSRGAGIHHVLRVLDRRGLQQGGGAAQ